MMHHRARGILVGLMALAFLGAGCGRKAVPGTDVTAEETAPGAETPGTGEGDGSGTGTPEVRETTPGMALEDVFFDFDKYELRSEARFVLQQNARYLKETPGVVVTLEGHCDERGTNEYNLALGQRRAEAVKAYLVDLGVAPERLRTISYGEEKPFALGHTEEAWAQNRRVHFVVEN